MFQILVVEDDRDLNRTVCAFLNSSGYKATGCLGANEAYDAMYGTMFDLIVSDIMMPEIDGFEFVDTDELIAKMYGQPAYLIKTQGELAFRELEKNK